MLIANETNATNLQNAERLRTLFQSKKMVWEEIDGTDPNNKEKRSELFRISGLRAEYPQVFFLDCDSCEYRFVGNYGKISTLNEMNGILKENPEMLESNPHLADQVFDKVFEKVLVVDRDLLESPCTGTLTRLQLQQQESSIAEPQVAGEELLESSCAETLQAESQQEGQQQQQQEDTKAERQPPHPFTFQLKSEQLPEDDMVFEPSPEVAPERAAEPSAEHQGSSVRLGEKRKREEEQQEKEDQEEHVQEEKHQEKSVDEPQHLRKRDRIKRRLRGIFNALFSSSA